MEQVFGVHHNNVAITLVELAKTYGELGDTQRQVELTERVEEIERRHADAFSAQETQPEAEAPLQSRVAGPETGVSPETWPQQLSQRFRAFLCGCGAAAPGRACCKRR